MAAGPEALDQSTGISGTGILNLRYLTFMNL